MLKIRKTIVLALAFCGLCTKAVAQQTTIHLQPADTTGMQLFLYAIDNDDSTEPMERTGALDWRQETKRSEVGMYNLVYVSTALQAQYSTPLYFEGALPSELNLQMVDGCPRLTALPAGKKKADKEKAERTNHQLDAIFAFNQVYYKLSREVWTQAQRMTPEDLRTMLKTYDEAQQAVAGDEAIGQSLKEYMDVWTYLLKSEAVTVYNRYHTDAPVKAQEALGCTAQQKLDRPMALLHQSALNTAAQDLPKGTLLERMAYIADNYKCAEMKAGIQHIVAESFIRSYKFDKGYQQGLDLLQEATEKYGLDAKYAAKFRERIAAVPGAAFPDVKLIDADGNEVSLAKFKGKYVYIDLWASWCVPCVKEVPFLQELEKSLQNQDVVFVSISTDSSEKPWRSRMEALKMHGNQWLNTDGKLCDKLNVSGIPHFLIYDKEGHLHTYNAPRPSTGEQLKGILENLK